MHLFINKVQPEVSQDDFNKSSVQFKAKINKNTVTGISDDIFKMASAAITAAGVAGIVIKENAAKKDKEQENIVTKNYLAQKILQVNVHSVEWHIKAGHIIRNEDGKIDLNNPVNKLFIENFQKGKRTKVEILSFTPELYPKLQDILGKNLPLEYCLKFGILTADEKGVINANDEQNKEFLQKIVSGEISYKNYFQTREDYAAYLGIGLATVVRAVQKGKIKVDKITNRIDINNPQNLQFQEMVEKSKKDANAKGLKYPRFFSVPKPRENNPNKYTLKELAEKLGYTQPSALSYHIKSGRIVVEDGFVDISKEPNKSFYAAKLGGHILPKPVKQSETKKTKEEENPDIKLKSEVAKELGIKFSTLMYHLQQGHIVLTEDGKIDITDERNRFFLENHQKGVVLYPNIKEDTVKPAETNIPEEKNPNFITLTELSSVTGLTQWPLIVHVGKGRLVREKEGFDITNTTNKFFINKYEENGIEKLDNLSIKELHGLKQRIENRYQSLIPRTIYIQAKDAKNKSEKDFDTFIKNTVFGLFRVEILSEQELNFVENIVKNIINTRLDNETKPEDFSDLKEFYLTDVIELEHELNIIDKLIDVEKNNYMENIRLEKLKDITQKDKIKLPKDFLDKFITNRIGFKSINYEKMSVEDLKQKLLEFYSDKNISENNNLESLISFMYDYEFKTKAEKEILVSFVKELESYISKSKGKGNFSKEITQKIKELENNFIDKEQKKAEIFEKVNSELNDSINLLYSKGLTKAAEVCYSYIPESPDKTKQINLASHLIELAFSLNETVTLPNEFKTKSKEEKNAELERLQNKKIQETENAILGFNLKHSKSPMLKEAEKYSIERYGVIDDKFLGEYSKHVSNLENQDFSSYPEFCKNLYNALSKMDKKDAVTILSKLEEWNSLSDSDKKKFRSISQLFSKDNSVELQYLTEYIQNYYKDFDTVITAVNVNDAKTRIPATLSAKAKEMMFKKVVLNELPDYFDAFEYAMQKIVPDGNGIKKHYTKKHEVRISLPARLYSPTTDFYFDEFEYNAHQGSKT